MVRYEYAIMLIHGWLWHCSHVACLDEYHDPNSVCDTDALGMVDWRALRVGREAACLVLLSSIEGDFVVLRHATRRARRGPGQRSCI